MSINVYIDKFGTSVIGAVAEGNKLLEYHVEKLNKTQIVGNIYKGKIKNILQGMQAAFVDVGLEKNGYLFVGETLVDKKLLPYEMPTTLNYNEGDDVMVQVVKDPVGVKGARLTTNISIVGKYVVYVPNGSFNTVSRKISNEKERERLTKTLESIRRKDGGLIARTCAENISSLDIKKEAKNLIAQHAEIIERYNASSAGDVVYAESDLVMRLIRDVVNVHVDKIIVGDKGIYERLKKLPASREKIKKKLVLYEGNTDMFKHYGLDSDVESLLHSRVNLSSGAYLIIDRTEALTVIDVNTGSFVGGSDLENTVFETNVLAAKEIARQVRLRNVGGIVVVDFIDMADEDHREKLVEALKEYLASDRMKCNVIGMTGLGIIEFTRSKKRKEVSEILNKPCPYCKGEGKILSDDYIVMKIRVGLLDAFAEGYKSCIVNLNKDICDHILREGALSVDAKKYWEGRRVYLVPHKTYHQEYFTIKGDNEAVLSVPDNAILLY